MHRQRNPPPVLYTDASPDEPIVLPFKFEICPQCSGHKKSSLYLGAFTREDFDREGADFYHDYMDGHYDRTCETCDGEGMVKSADYSRMTPDQITQYNQQLDDDAEIDAEHEAERRMGC